IPNPSRSSRIFLLRACKEKDIVGDLRILLNEQAQGIGLLVIKHMNNIPRELFPPLYNILFNEVAQLFNEVAQVAQHEFFLHFILHPTHFKFKVYLLITRIYK
ncbi:hypothetical protein MKX03_015131, partial [Papaver bracteatum]